MTGSVGILNVGCGDTKLSFNKDDPAECIRAARIVKDMIQRGYVLLVKVSETPEGEKKYQRAKDFDENTCEYLIADFDPIVAAAVDEAETDVLRDEGVIGDVERKPRRAGNRSKRLKPTIAMADEKEDVRILAALCMHPIAYYEGSWAGAMVPTDDVIAHLMMMRADEHMFWKRCNQHPPHKPEAGL